MLRSRGPCFRASLAAQPQRYEPSTAAVASGSGRSIRVSRRADAEDDPDQTLNPDDDSIRIQRVSGC